MSSIGDSGGKKKWDALVKVYDYMYSTYPDFCKQVEKFGYSTIESNDKDELILEMDNNDSDIVVDSDRIIRLLKKAGLKKFSKIESLTFDRVLEYDYNMSKGLLNILVRRAKGGKLSLNLHFYYIENEGIPTNDYFLMRRDSKNWSEEFSFSNFLSIFSSILISPLHKEGLYWIHMVRGNLQISVVSNGECVESFKYGQDVKIDDVIGRLLGYLSDLFEYPIKDILILSEDVTKCRYRKNEDGEITVVLY